MARQEVRPAVTWALERAPNPRVIRVHTTVELTRATIEKCPPASPPEGLRSLLAVDGVRSVDLHRYRARLNLDPGCDAKAAADGVAGAIQAAWGAPAPLPGEPAPRAFGVAYEEGCGRESGDGRSRCNPRGSVPGPRGGRGHPRGWQGMGPAGPPVLLGGRGDLGPLGSAECLGERRFLASTKVSRAVCPGPSGHRHHPGGMHRFATVSRNMISGSALTKGKVADQVLPLCERRNAWHPRKG